MFNNRIKELFEATDVTGFLSLKKTQVDDNTLLNHLAIKPSEINIILSRTVSFLKNEATDKSKKDLINDILEVLERSDVAREFVGIGVKDEYRLYKGFPVRKGDPYETLPEPNSEMQLKPSELFIGWMSDLTKAKEDAIKYDAAKGEPIGGLVAFTHTDTSKILFDINAVVNVVKSRKNVLDLYNSKAAPGKSLSKTNIEFLANEAPIYHGQWEIITSNKVINVRIADKWVWDIASGTKSVKWSNPAQEQQQHQQQQPAQEDPQKREIKENIKKLFECLTYEITETPEEMEEGVWQGMKNFFAKTFSTTRGKMLSFLDTYVKYYDAEVKTLQAAIEHAKNIDDTNDRINVLSEMLRVSKQNLIKAQKELSDYQEEKKKEDLPATDELGAKHAAMKDIKAGATNTPAATTPSEVDAETLKKEFGIGE